MFFGKEWCKNPLGVPEYIAVVDENSEIICCSNKCARNAVSF